MIACRGQHDKDLEWKYSSIIVSKGELIKMDYGKFIMAKDNNQIINEVAVYIHIAT